MGPDEGKLACDDPDICQVVRGTVRRLVAMGARLSGLAAEESSGSSATGMLLNVLA